MGGNGGGTPTSFHRVVNRKGRAGISGIDSPSAWQPTTSPGPSRCHFATVSIRSRDLGVLVGGA